MKKLYSYFSKFFGKKHTPSIEEAKNFFDLPSRERVKIMRAAGREAQKEQQSLLRKYAAVYSRS